MRSKQKKSLINKTNIMGLFIVLLMVFSIAGIMVGNSSQTDDNYNGQKFKTDGNLWYTEYKDKGLVFAYHPGQLEYIQMPDDASSDLWGADAWVITMDPEDAFVSDIELAKLQMREDLYPLMDKFVAEGVTSPSQLYLNFPVISCVNATASMPVISLGSGTENNLSYENYCLTATFDSSYGAQAMKERITYFALGMMK